MKMNFIKFISILFLIVLFTNCVSAQSKSKSTESYDISKNTVLVLYCQDTNEAYYLEDENEINADGSRPHDAHGKAAANAADQAEDGTEGQAGQQITAEAHHARADHEL